ncbi:MAG: hypothetical protein KAW86_07010 [Bacteroidales bacterium]|nr:hypothetical protein [Bacteroidales bacterium]
MNLSEKIEKISKDYSNNLGLRFYVSLIPTIGGTIDLLMTSKWQDSIKKRIKIFFDAVKEEFDDIEENKIDKKFLESEEFMDLFINSLNLASKTRSNDKIRIYTKILKGSLIIKNDEFNSEDYLHVLEELTPNELSFAKQFYDLKIAKNEYLSESQNDIVFTSINFVNITKQKSEYYFKRLEKVGLVSELVGSYIGYGGGIYNLTELFKSLMNYIK